MTDEKDILAMAMVAVVGLDKTKKILEYAKELVQQVEEIETQVQSKADDS